MPGASGLRVGGRGQGSGDARRHTDLAPALALPFQPGGRYVVCPYVPGKLHSRTRMALAWGRPAPFYLPISADDPYAYARLVVLLWATRATYVVVEHDVVPPTGAVAALFACPNPWCVHAYLIEGRRFVGGLGLVKLGADLMTGYPDLARRTLCREWDGYVDVTWQGVDMLLARALRPRVGDPCVHTPDAVHLHQY